MGSSESVRPLGRMSFHFYDIPVVDKATRLSILHICKKRHGCLWPTGWNSSFPLSIAAFAIFSLWDNIAPISIWKTHSWSKDQLKCCFSHKISSALLSRNNLALILCFFFISHLYNIPHKSLLIVCLLYTLHDNQYCLKIVCLFIFYFLLHLSSSRMLDTWGQDWDWLVHHLQD